jgi:hypothetical protein
MRQALLVVSVSHQPSEFCLSGTKKRSQHQRNAKESHQKNERKKKQTHIKETNSNHLQSTTHSEMISRRDER